MSGTRFARTGRIRFLLCFLALLLTVGTIAIFHSSQRQLDNSREALVRCEKQQEAVNVQLQSMVEQKYTLEKSHDIERDDQMETRRGLEQKLKMLSDQLLQQQKDNKLHYETLEKKYSLLQTECGNNKKSMSLDREALEKKIDLTRTELQEAKNVLAEWQQKHADVSQAKEQTDSHAADLEKIISEYKKNCSFKPKNLVEEQQQLQLNKPLSGPRETTRKSNAKVASLDKPRNEKSFNVQEVVSPGIYQLSFKSSNETQNAININNTSSTTSTTTNNSKRALPDGGVKVSSDVASLNLEKIKQLLPYTAMKHHTNQSLILNSVENFQILPKPLNKVGISDETETQLKQQPANEQQKKPSTSTDGQKAQNVLEANAHLKPAFNATASSSSSNLPPLVQPPNQRKPIPEMVAPVPAAEFAQLVRNDEHAEAEKPQIGALEDIDAAVEEMPKNENENNRYANVHGGDDAKQSQNKAAANEDSGAHEIKDHDFINDPNFNLPGGEDNNIFGKQMAAVPDNEADASNNNKHKRNGDNEDEDDDLAPHAPDDIAVKNLDEDNLNNELLGDQGKELEGLHLEDGNDEDEDEDDYSNAARHQGGDPAIRN